MFEEAISLELKNLLISLAGYREIVDKFYLAGGTGLALLIGHRISKDIDLFSRQDFDLQSCLSFVTEQNGQIITQERGTVHALCQGVRLSLLSYPYGLLSEVLSYQGMSLAAMEDIACMKAIAVAQRGAKKDFVDLYFLMQKLSPERIKDLILKKYGKETINLYHLLKSFTYFEDAEEDPDPMMLINVSWPEIKKFFLSQEKDLTRIFLN